MGEWRSAASSAFDDYLLRHSRAAFLSGPPLRTDVVVGLPRMLARMAACRLVRAERARRGLHTPALMFMAITGACNFRCSYCYTQGYGSGHMEVPLARRILSEAYELGVSMIVLSGGEPLLHQEFFPIVASMPDVPFIVFSNGTLVPAFLENGRVSPNMLWTISVDGPRECNDVRRGEGAFDAACEAMAALKSHGLPFGFSATLSIENVTPALSPGFVSMMVERGCRTGFFLEQIPGPLCDPPLGQQIAAGLAACRHRSPIPLIGFPADEVYYGGCQAGGKGMLHISPDGSVEPCPASRIAVDSLADVSLADALANPFFDELRQKGQELSADSQPCHHVGSDAQLQEILTGHGARPTA